MLASLLFLVAPVVVVGLPPSPGHSAGLQQPRRDYATLDVCKELPGEAIAAALGGKLAEARPFGDKAFSRCTYIITLPGGTQRKGFVVWMQPPEDFEELRKQIEAPLTTLPGLGDGAYMFQDQGDGRFKINVLKRGDSMFQASGDSAASARKVADAVAAQLWKKTR